LILRKIIETKFDFGWGSAPDPLGHWGSFSAPQTLYLDFRGPTSNGSEGERRKRERKGRERKGEGKGGNSQFPTPLGQANPLRRPGLWVT